jgi:hypothetical protein
MSQGDCEALLRAVLPVEPSTPSAGRQRSAKSAGKKARKKT